MGKPRIKEKKIWEVKVDDLLGKIRKSGMRCKGRGQFLDVLIPIVFGEYTERGLAELYKKATESDKFTEVFGEAEEEEVEEEAGE